MCILQETSFTPARSISRQSEPRIVEFATPKARLFHSLKYGSKSASSSLWSASGHDRILADTQNNEALSVQTHTADVLLSNGYSMLSPQSHVTTSFISDSVECDSLATESTSRLPESTLSWFNNPEDEACVDQVSCFHKSTTSQS